MPETPIHQVTMLAVNEALVLGSLHQHELVEAAEALNAELQAEITDRKRTEALLSCQKKAFEMIAVAVPLIEVLEFLARATERQSRQHLLVAFHLLDRSGTRFERTAAPSLPAAYSQLVDGVAVSSAIGSCCAAVTQRRRVVVPDLAASKAFPAFAALALPLGLRAVWSTPIISPSGNVLGTFVSYCREVCAPVPQDEALDAIVTWTAAVCIERKNEEEKLRESEAFSHSAFEANPDCVKIIGFDGRIERMNANGLCLMEIDDFGAVAGAHWPSLWPPDSRAEVEAAIVEAQAGRSGHFSGLCPTAKGTPKWWDVIVNAVPGASGAPLRLIAASRDITERKLAEQREVLLARELAHRGRNLLSVVKVIVSRSLSGGRPMAEAREVLAARLQALSRSLSIVLVDGIDGVPLAGTIAAEFNAFSEQVKAVGPDIMMNPKVAQTFALLVHELATNAMKYGALSQPGGRIAIRWSVEEDAATGARFKFFWQESGGPPVVAPTRQGFGRVVVEKLVKAEFGAAPVINFDPAGLRYELDVPLPSIAAAGLQRGRQARPD